MENPVPGAGRGERTPSGLVLEIQKMSTEDGPGLRTTVFLKGCSLSCLWCHNPESISPRPQIRWSEDRCIGCGSCVEVCPVSALEAGSSGIRIDRRACSGCGVCAEECPSGAIEVWGGVMTADELVDELLKDRAYFGDTGGVTLSGGEAALQADFAAAVFRRLREEGIHTALDTGGVCTTEQLDAACEYADLILFDMKESDAALHKRYTGGSLERVKKSLEEAAAIVENSRIPSLVWSDNRSKGLWIRTPVIPGLTDRTENITEIAEYLLSAAGDLFERWELCAFNNLCGEKYRILGLDWELENAGLMSAERMDELAAAAVDAGIDPGRVGWSGRVEDGTE